MRDLSICIAMSKLRRGETNVIGSGLTIRARKVTRVLTYLDIILRACVGIVINLFRLLPAKNVLNKVFNIFGGSQVRLRSDHCRSVPVIIFCPTRR